MEANLKAYMVRLAIDPSELSAFISDPVKTATAAKLSDEDISILISGDQNRIYSSVAMPQPSQQSGPQKHAAADATPDVLQTPTGYYLYPAYPYVFSTAWGPVTAYFIVPLAQLGVQQTVVTAPLMQSSDPIESTRSKLPQEDKNAGEVIGSGSQDANDYAASGKGKPDTGREGSDGDPVLQRAGKEK